MLCKRNPYFLLKSEVLRNKSGFKVSIYSIEKIPIYVVQTRLLYFIRKGDKIVQIKAIRMRIFLCLLDTYKS